MRIFIILTLFVTMALAKDEVCYSIELESAYASQKNISIFQEKSYPKACKVLRISSAISVRCECLPSYKEIKVKLPKYKKIQSKAIIVKTYTKRFFSESRRETKSKNENTDEELRLMLNSFLYTGDIENAYKVAQIGYKKYPRSIFWLQKNIETALWSSNIHRAFILKKELYAQTKSKKLRNEIINDALKLYQYESIESLVIEKFREVPSDENANLLVYIEYKIGNPDKAAKILAQAYWKNEKRVYLLTHLLKIYLDLGSMEQAKKIVSIIEEKRLYSKVNTMLVANYYYSQNNIQKAYATLLHLKDKNMMEPSYYQAVSDFAWYLNDFKNAVWASKYLLQKQQARTIDFSRIIEYYKDRDKSYSAKVAKDAFLHYKIPYYFFYYANSMIEIGHYDELEKILIKLEKDNLFNTNAMFWIIEAEVAQYNQDTEASLIALQKAFTLEPNNPDIFENIIWALINIGNYKEVSRLLVDNEDKYINAKGFYNYASFYFQLNNINHADFYLQKALDKDEDLKNNLEVLYLQASIYQAQKKEGAAREIYEKILEQIKQEYKLGSRREDNIYAIYFAAAINVYDRDRLEEELKKYKKYLSDEEYTNISYSLASKDKAYEKSHLIYTQAKKRAVWMALSDALLFSNYTQMEDLLHQHLQQLPKEDATQAALKDRQISLAQSLSFESLDTNQFSNNAYNAHLELSKKRDDIFDIKTALYSRKPLVQEVLKIKNRTYLCDDIYLFTKINLYKNTTTDTKQLANINDTTTVFDIALQKEWLEYLLYVHYGYKKALENYTQYGVVLDSKITDKLRLRLNYEKAKDVEDSTILYVGAKKDMFEAHLYYGLLNSLLFDFLYQKNYFSSQDDLKLGSENYLRMGINKQLRLGYPDIGIGAFFDMGDYTRDALKKRGVIGTISQENIILPKDFYNLGVELRYGMQNSDLYTRVWRPYFSVSPYFNSYSNNFNIGISAGYGGKVYKNDHLIFGFDYSQPANGIKDQIYKLFINYKLLY